MKGTKSIHQDQSQLFSDYALIHRRWKLEDRRQPIAIFRLPSFHRHPFSLKCNRAQRKSNNKVNRKKWYRTASKRTLNIRLSFTGKINVDAWSLQFSAFFKNKMTNEYNFCKFTTASFQTYQTYKKECCGTHSLNRSDFHHWQYQNILSLISNERLALNKGGPNSFLAKKESKITHQNVLKLQTPKLSKKALKTMEQCIIMESELNKPR